MVIALIVASGDPHQAAVFFSGGARTQLKRRLIAFVVTDTGRGIGKNAALCFQSVRQRVSSY